MALPNLPQSRNEKYLAKIAGQEVELPNEPLSREEQYLEYIATHGGGGGSSLEAGDYIDIIEGVISVKKEKGEYLLERYVLQSTGTGAPKLVVKKYIDSELISTNEYANNTAHVNIDDTLEIWYSYNPYNWHYKLLTDGVDHSTGYEYEFSYDDTTEYPVDFHIEAGDSTDLVTKGDLEDAVDEITDNLTASNGVPFRFGYDQSTGKYGYILNEGGADTVIPFSNSEGYNPFTFGECYSYCVNDSVTMTARYTAEHSIKYVFFFIASDAFEVPEINVTVTVNGVSKTELVKEMYRDENSYFDVKYICVELEVGDVCVFNTTGTKGTGTSSAIYGARVGREFNTGDIIDSDKYAGVSTPEYLTSTIEETGSYFLFFFARCSNNNAGFNELSINDVPYDIFTVLKYDSWSAAIGITYAELQEDDVVKIGGGQWGGYYTSEAFGIISAE